MTKFYVTFGAGTLLRGYHAIVEAHDEAIVRAWLDKKEKIRWSNIYTKEPKHSVALRPEHEVLFYLKAEHIQ